MFEIFILSIIQGITEFLPISSSSHLILISNYVDFEHKSLSIDVSLHIGSLLAVITYFYKDLVDFTKNKKLFLKILISSIPVVIAGLLLVKTNYIENLRNIEVIGWSTLIFGILLYISDKVKLEKEINNNFTFKTSIIIGLFQILALIPGVSRSGITITSARALGFKRYDAYKISFLLSIPALSAVSIFGLKNIVFSDSTELSILNLIVILLSFIFSFITIKFFLKYIQRFSLSIFVIYRIALGILILFYNYL
tara:strand:+ start:363 stop:1121 length:759 start_codon:yes stop_codon:yes gene_type:complete